MEWQLIDSVPKDKAVLLYANEINVGHWNTFYKKWIIYGFDTPCTVMYNTINKPTHWMPLPDPPGES